MTKNLSASTVPSASTGRPGGAGLRLAVHWGFPGRARTPLVGSQLVGRDETCDTVLAGNEISRRHAELRVDGPRIAVHDLASRNGVFVNGVRRGEAELASGDVLRCGEWVGVVVVEEEPMGFGEIASGWYGGAAMHAAVETARRVAPSDLPVVVQGETGTGKEGMARAIHAWSGRGGPLVPVNCAAIPAHLAEAELFGYRRGAFSGAERAHPGLVRTATGGTLFLDEVLELPAAVQPKLLRFLEQKEVLAIGETAAVRCDVRVIAASQQPLAEAVARDAFRPDLRARLEGTTVVLPPLRHRREDIAPLFLTFLRDYGGGSVPDVQVKLVETLCLYDWPLNVRELVLLTRGLLSLHGSEPVLERAHLPDRILSWSPGRLAGEQTGRPKRAWRRTDDPSEFERLVDSLRAHQGVVATASAAIGMSRNRAYRLLAAQSDMSLEEFRKPR